MASRSETVEAILFALCVGLFFGKPVRFELKDWGKVLKALWKTRCKKNLRRHSIDADLCSLSTPTPPFLPPFPQTTTTTTSDDSLPRLHLLHPAALPQGHLPRARRSPRRPLPLARRGVGRAARLRDPNVRRSVHSQQHHGGVVHRVDLRADRRVRPAAGDP